jgi:ketosteroid isomerase-like protein
MKIKVSVCLVFALTQLACKSIIHKSDKATGEILARSAQWNQAFAEKNMAAVMELFSSDAQLATAGGKWQGQEEGLRKFSMLLQKRPDLRWTILPQEIVVNKAWEVAYETGTWMEWWSEEDGLAKITGTYFMMWKKQRNEPWLIHAVIFTPLSCKGESAYCKPHQKT